MIRKVAIGLPLSHVPQTRLTTLPNQAYINPNSYTSANKIHDTLPLHDLLLHL